MRALPNLVRQNRWRLDEHRRKVSSLEALKAALIEDRDRLERALADEREAARGSLEAQAAFAAYSAAALDRIARITASIDEIETAIEAAREEAREAFSELKKYETALENHERRRLAELARRQQTLQDEIALNIFRRKEVAGTAA